MYLLLLCKPNPETQYLIPEYVIRLNTAETKSSRSRRDRWAPSSCSGRVGESCAGLQGGGGSPPSPLGANTVCKAYFHLFPISVTLRHGLGGAVRGAGFQLCAGQERGDSLPQPLTCPWAAGWDGHPCGGGGQRITSRQLSGLVKEDTGLMPYAAHLRFSWTHAEDPVNREVGWRLSQFWRKHLNG